MSRRCFSIIFSYWAGERYSLAGIGVEGQFNSFRCLDLGYGVNDEMSGDVYPRLSLRNGFGLSCLLIFLRSFPLSTGLDGGLSLRFYAVFGLKKLEILVTSGKRVEVNELYRLRAERRWMDLRDCMFFSADLSR